MSKNIVYITAVDPKGERGYKNFCKESWENWCFKNKAELVFAEQPEIDFFSYPADWGRYFALRELKRLGVSFNQVAIVDLDTVIHSDLDNFFELTDGELAATLDYDGPAWYVNSIQYFSPLFPDVDIEFDSYLNSGFIVVNQKHEALFERMIDFYQKFKNNEKQIEVLNPATGRDQTPFNFLFREMGYRATILPKRFNLTHPDCKNLNSAEEFFKLPSVWHFNTMPTPARNTNMAKVWLGFKELYDLR